MTRTARALMLGTALMTLAAPAVASAQSQPGGSSPMQVHAMAQQPALNLSAFGEVKVAPDQATINFGVVTEAATMKGMKVTVETTALGRRCLNMILVLVRPRARAARTYSKLRAR